MLSILLNFIPKMQSFSLVSRMSNFLYGITIAEAVLNAFCYSLNYSVIPTGIEHSYGALNRSLRKSAFSSKNKETLINIEGFRKDPDAVLISPSKEVIRLEIKSKSSQHLIVLFHQAITEMKLITF